MLDSKLLYKKLTEIGKDLLGFRIEEGHDVVMAIYDQYEVESFLAIANYIKNDIAIYNYRDYYAVELIKEKGYKTKCSKENTYLALKTIVECGCNELIGVRDMYFKELDESKITINLDGVMIARALSAQPLNVGKIDMKYFDGI